MGNLRHAWRHFFNGNRTTDDELEHSDIEFLESERFVYDSLEGLYRYVDHVEGYTLIVEIDSAGQIHVKVKQDSPTGRITLKKTSFLFSKMDFRKVYGKMLKYVEKLSEEANKAK